MADVKVCDRCGKMLTDKDERSIFTVKPNRYTLGVTLFKKPDYWGDQKTIKTEHDLCIECTTALAEWLEHETKEAEKNGNS